MSLEQRVEAVRERARRLVEASRLPGLVTPDYEGSCISNLPGTIAALLRAPAPRSLPPLPGIKRPPQADTWRRVALIVLDAFGLDLFLRSVAEVPALRRLVERGMVAPLTSVFPSTTNVALTSLYTGLTPAEHGIAGLLLYLRELGVTANLLHFRAVGDRVGETLRARGLDPRGFFPVTTLFERLAAAGCRSASISRNTIVGTSLAEIHHAGADVYAYLTSSDLCVTLGRLLADTGGPGFVFAYWDLIDTLSHRYGPASEEVIAEVAAFFAALEREVLDRLSPAARRETLLLITADHGHLSMSGESGVRLEERPEISACLSRPPGGSARYPYLHVLPGRMEALREGFGRLAEPFALIETERAIADGLFGLGEPHPELRWRIGDMIALAEGDACFWRADVSPEVRRVRGLHGGLSEAEMLVPLLAVPLDEL